MYQMYCTVSNWAIMLLVFTSCLLPSCKDYSGKPKQQDLLISYVDPMIGTAAHGHTFPGPVYPFGQIQPSPDNGRSGWDWSSGYHYSDSMIAGFSLTHLSGTGIGDLCDILLMPTLDKIDHQYFSYTNRVNDTLLSKFSHDSERAYVGYYSVELEKHDIRVELTTGKRVAMQRYTYPSNAQAQLVVDLGYSINFDKTDTTFIKKVAPNRIVGYRFSKGWAVNQKVFFALEFSEPISDFEIFTQQGTYSDSVGGKNLKAVIRFNPGKNKIIVKAAISSADMQGAMRNLESNQNGFNFEALVRSNQTNWELQLKKIKVETEDDELKKVFYTALYHSFVAPYIFSDVDGRFKGHKHQIKESNGYDQYTVLSLWDTFRALKPLYAITQPNVLNDVIKSMLSQYDDTGFLSKWELMGNETDCMIGFNSAPIITDAIAKNIGDFDRNKAYMAMRDYAMSNIDGLTDFRNLGYVPSDDINESASKTLEYSYNFYCVGKAAELLGKKEDEAFFKKISNNYKNLFDQKIKFIRGKQADGKFAEPFDPYFSQHRKDYFTEGNSWQWSWFAPHDTPGLIELHGNKQVFVTKLDSLFSVSTKVKGEHASIDISGLIGQYAHGNEPSHGTAYLYEVAGVNEYRTQEIVDEALQNLYSAKIDGLCGNDDCGQMSAWYVWSAMGLYPFNPPDNRYYFGRPMFDSVTIELANGRNFCIKANNVSKNSKYITAAFLNNKVLDRKYITYEELMNGGELLFEMSSIIQVK